jgi:hypothetical protein
LAARVGVVALDRPPQIGDLFAGIGEGIALGIGLDRKARVRLAVVVDLDPALEAQFLGLVLELRDGDRIGKDVVQPVHLGRRRDH